MSKPQNKLKIYNWPLDQAEICSILRSHKAFYKVVLKTKDEVYFIERWIQHYLELLGTDAILPVFDHMSTNPLVYEIYEKYADNILLIQHSWGFNTVHVTNLMYPFYAALRASSTYYSFLDTDEFLYLYAGGKLQSGAKVLQAMARFDANFLPTMWLNNTCYSERFFSFSGKYQQLLHDFLHGKPILNSRAFKDDMHDILHNLHIPFSYRCVAPTPFVLIHLSTANIARRIQVNMDKMVQTHILPDNMAFDILHELDLEQVSHFRQNMVKHTLELIELEKNGVQEPETPLHETVIFDKNAALQFTPAELKDVFKYYVNPAADFFELFNAPPLTGDNAQLNLWNVLDADGYNKYFKPVTR